MQVSCQFIFEITSRFCFGVNCTVFGPIALFEDFILTIQNICVLVMLGRFIFNFSSIKLVWRLSGRCLLGSFKFISCSSLYLHWYWIVWVLVFVSLYWIILDMLSLTVKFPSTLFWKGGHCGLYWCLGLLSFRVSSMVTQVCGVAPLFISGK